MSLFLVDWFNTSATFAALLLVNMFRDLNNIFKPVFFIFCVQMHCMFYAFLGMKYASYLHMKMEQTECSETSAYKIQTPGNYPEESTQHSTQRKFEIKKYSAGLIISALYN